MKKFVWFMVSCGWVLPLCAMAKKKSENLGTLATDAVFQLDIFTKFLNTACYLLGGSFVFASLAKYIEHRRNPLMVPISTVVFLLLAGLMLLALPLTPLLLHYLETKG